jgi:aromatic-L-amino-acid/L-tryptophan decarboxylase
LITSSDRAATRSTAELELSAETMHSLVDQAMERIAAHIESLPSQPAADVTGARELIQSLVEEVPGSGTPFPELLDLLFEKVFPKSFNTAGPGYLAYIPGGGIFHSAVADLIADSVNRYVGVWITAPGLSQIEANVVRWFCDLVGYPREARGILTTGGSMANFTAVVTARRTLLPANFLTGVLYSLDQVHYSMAKAAVMAGFPEENFREIPSDERFRVRTDLLARAIDRDRDRGLSPFMIVGNAGTVNTGAVDDLEALAEIAAEKGLWFHVDAAYGGFFVLTERGRIALRGIQSADSITLDPHKALFLPYGTGALLVRDGDRLRQAHAAQARYLPPMQDDPDLVDFCLYSPELSRGFRGLRVWLPFKMHGIEPFRENLDEKLDLIQWVTRELFEIPGIEVVASPQLTVVAFRLVRPGLSEERLNDLNRQLLQQVNAKKRVYLSGTTLFNRFVLRICILSFRTHLDRVEAALEDLRKSVKEVLS